MRPRRAAFGTAAAPAAKVIARVDELGVGMARPREADLRGARPVDRGAEQHHRGRGLRADGAVEHPRVTAAGMQPDAQETGVEAGRLAREPNVAREREVQPGADRGPVHRGDRRERRAQHAQETLVDRA